MPGRLLAFHGDFARVHLNRERVRLSLFFALRGWGMTTYLRLMRDRVYVPIAAGLREYAGEPGVAEEPLRDVEVELAKSVVEKIQYNGARKWVYEIPTLSPVEPMIAVSVRGLLDGARMALPAFRGQGESYPWGTKSIYALMKPALGAATDAAVDPHAQATARPAEHRTRRAPIRRAAKTSPARPGEHA